MTSDWTKCCTQDESEEGSDRYCYRQCCGMCGVFVVCKVFGWGWVQKHCWATFELQVTPLVWLKCFALSLKGTVTWQQSSHHIFPSLFITLSLCSLMVWRLAQNVNFALLSSAGPTVVSNMSCSMAMWQQLNIWVRWGKCTGRKVLTQN